MQEFGNRYLVSPDLFPARQSGLPWGNNQADISFAGVRYRFSGMHPEQRDIISGGHAIPQDQAVQAGSACISSQFFKVERSEFTAYVGRDYEYDFRYDEHAVQLVGPEFMASITREKPLRGALWLPAFEGWKALQAVVNFYRVLVAYQTLNEGGLMVHSSCAINDGKAYLFVGHSGAGKSTFAEISETGGRVILSDDINIVRPDNGKYVVQGLPFTGDHERRAVPGESFPLAGVCYLRQDRDSCFDIISSGDAFSRLISCAPFVNQDPFNFDSLAETVEKIVNSAPQYRLQYSLDSDPWAEIEAMLP